MQPREVAALRAAALASRRAELGLDARTLARCAKVVGAALGGGEHLTRTQLGERLVKARVDISGQRLPHILMHLELELVICSGAPAGKQHTYALFDERVPPGPAVDQEEARRALVARYLRSHGPAAIKDPQWWASLTASAVRSALDDLGARRVEAGDAQLWLLPEPRRRPGTGVVRLVETYDEFVVGYTSTRFFGDPNAGRVQDAWWGRGASAPRNAIVRGGELIGLWRRRTQAKGVSVKLVTFAPPSARLAGALRAEAERFAACNGAALTLEGL